MHIHSSTVCALLGLGGLIGSPFLPQGPGAIVFLSSLVALIVAIGLGFSGFVLQRPRSREAAVGLALGLVGLIGFSSFFAWTGVVDVQPTTVQATEVDTETR